MNYNIQIRQMDNAKLEKKSIQSCVKIFETKSKIYS
jgi:hypothetical protein